MSAATGIDGNQATTAQLEQLRPTSPSGIGAFFGDVLRCARASVIRLGTKIDAGGGSQYPTGADPTISVEGLNATGGFRTYEVWYRNAASFCHPETLDLSNGLQVTWTP